MYNARYDGTFTGTANSRSGDLVKFNGILARDWAKNKTAMVTARDSGKGSADRR